MNKQEILDGMSVSELRDAIYVKQEQESKDRYGSKKEVPFTIEKVIDYSLDINNPLFLVRVDDGCEGWEALVEVSREVTDEWMGEEEQLVEDHIINFMIENDYYENGGVEEITVDEICRYSRNVFKINQKG